MSRQISIRDDIYDQIVGNKPNNMSFSQYLELLIPQGDPMIELVNESMRQIESAIATKRRSAYTTEDPYQVLLDRIRILILTLYHHPNIESGEIEISELKILQMIQKLKGGGTE